MGVQSRMFPLILSTLTLSFLIMMFAQPVSKKIGLDDVPNARKKHEGSIPLVGGVSSFLAILLSSFMFLELDSKHLIFFLCSSTLVVLGIFDDRFDLSVKLRILVQALVSFTMIYFADIQISSLGNLFFASEFNLNSIAPIFTVLVVIGMINAFNMVDGIDGLVGSLSLITFAFLSVFLKLVDNDWWLVSTTFSVSLLVYLMFNLGWPTKRLGKIFMGDAGSMLIGFSIVWLLIIAITPSTSEGSSAISPITALYLTAIPVMDMLAIIYRRIKKGESPFKADRQHLHHIFERAGYTRRRTLLVISFASIFFCTLGLLGEYYHVAEHIMFYLFVMIFLIYNYVLTHIWVILKYVRKNKG